jgi:hypothetical protein
LLRIFDAEVKLAQKSPAIFSVTPGLRALSQAFTAGDERVRLHGQNGKPDPQQCELAIAVSEKPLEENANVRITTLL